MKSVIFGSAKRYNKMIFQFLLKRNCRFIGQLFSTIIITQACRIVNSFVGYIIHKIYKEKLSNIHTDFLVFCGNNSINTAKYCQNQLRSDKYEKNDRNNIGIVFGGNIFFRPAGLYIPLHSVRQDIAIDKLYFSKMLRILYV